MPSQPRARYGRVVSRSRNCTALRAALRRGAKVVTASAAPAGERVTPGAPGASHAHRRPSGCDRQKRDREPMRYCDHVNVRSEVFDLFGIVTIAAAHEKKKAGPVPPPRSPEIVGDAQSVNGAPALQLPHAIFPVEEGVFDLLAVIVHGVRQHSVLRGEGSRAFTALIVPRDFSAQIQRSVTSCPQRDRCQAEQE